MEQFERRVARLVGDALIGAAFVTHASGLPFALRQEAQRRFEAILEARDVPHTPGLTVHQMLASPLQVRAAREREGERRTEEGRGGQRGAEEDRGGQRRERGERRERGARAA
eukprot:817126-Prymnesium_polylepis.1